MIALDSPSLQVENSHDVPERTVTIGGDKVTIDAISRYNRGETISVTVSGPEDALVQLRNKDRQLEDVVRLSNDGTRHVTFSTEYLEPGTYAVALEINGAYEEAVPVVVSGYDLNVTAPSTVATDEQFVVTTELDYRNRTSPPEAVEIAVWNGDTVFNATAEQTAATTYRADFSLRDASPGNFQVYVAAISDEQVEGFPNALAIDSDTAVTVTEGAGNQNNSATETPTDNRTPTESGDGTGTPQRRTQTESNRDGTTPDDSVIEPNGTRTRTGVNSDGNGPGFGVSSLLSGSVLGIVLSLAYARRYR
ncbi:hypothetical protein [Halovenus aranensis]|uniref:hypothetical protein n=1 Tax=Halovenus aranensis TaxID=890420 RepID=UPI001179FC79|nr:hypothetical protein [Halovenus aranensis]